MIWYSTGVILRVAGSLGMFLFGMRIMSDGIQKIAGERLQKTISYMTGNRFSGIATGVAVTSLIQSSSATTVMTVSLVNLGVMTLVQAAGVIIGANIGTTITGWIVSVLGFKISLTKFALPIIGIGFPFRLFSKNEKKRDFGEFLVGFGLLFEGLAFLKKSIPTVNEGMLSSISQLTDMGHLSALLLMVIGVLLTIAVHSSSASMAIVLTMVHNGLLDFPMGAAMILGGNIGTTIDALIASVGAKVNAKRAALVHVMFNIIGVLLALAFFRPFLSLVLFITPDAEATIQLASLHTTFNIINAIFFLAFVPQLAQLVTKMIPQKEEDLDVYRLDSYHLGGVQDFPEGDIFRAKSEIKKMSEIVGTMFNTVAYLIRVPNSVTQTKVDSIRQKETYTDQMQEEITKFLIESSHQEGLGERRKESAAAMMRIVNELESVADNCYNLAILADRRDSKKISFHHTGYEELKPYTDLVGTFITFVHSHMGEHLSDKATEEAYSIESQINHFRNTLRKEVRENIKKGEDVKGELLYLDISKNLERIGDLCLNIAQAQRRLV